MCIFTCTRLRTLLRVDPSRSIYLSFSVTHAHARKTQTHRRSSKTEKTAPPLGPQVSTLQTEHSNDYDIKRMWSQMSVTEDQELVKKLLFEVSVAFMSYKSRQLERIQNEFKELLIYFDNETGDVSFGIKSTAAYQTQVFFPRIFQNLNPLFKDGQILFYLLFEAIFGVALSAEYMGAVAKLPPLSSDTANGRVSLSLQSMARFKLITTRARSLMQPLCKWALRTNSADYAREIFFPSLFAEARGEGNGLSGSFRELARRWLSLQRGNLRTDERNSHRHEITAFLPRRMNVSEMEGGLARFLIYQAFEYFDHLFVPRSRGRIVVDVNQ